MTTEIMTSRDLAAYLGMSEGALRIRVCRQSPDIPPPFRIGRSLRWRRATVEEWFSRKDVKAQKLLAK